MSLPKESKGWAASMDTDILETAIAQTMKNYSDRVRSRGKAFNEDMPVAGQEISIDYASSALKNILPAVMSEIQTGHISSYEELEAAMLKTQGGWAADAPHLLSGGRVRGEDTDLWDPKTRKRKVTGILGIKPRRAWEGNDDVQFDTIKEVSARIWQALFAVGENKGQFPRGETNRRMG